jgi:predicted  nucleic acid-binding Zn-ribbon protein
MLPDIQNLLKLQDADKEIRRLQDEVAELPKRVAVIEQKLAGTKAQLEKAQAAIKADEAARRKHDTTIADLRGKISKYRDQSLDVKTNEQYKALLHEIQFAEKEIAATEDKILELMLNADARDKEVKAAQAELKAETAEIEKEKADARQRTAEDEKLLTEWRAKRDQMRSGVDPDLLRHYERVSKFRGTGISEVRDEKCMACQVKLRPQTYNEVRSGLQTIVCDSCQRILYFNPADELAAQAPAASRARRHHPKIDAPQAWYYRADFADTGEVYLCLANFQGQASRRVYEIHTGRLFGDILIREGNYRQAFPEDITGAIRLNGAWSEADLETWANELPMEVLDLLLADLEAARLEMKARPAAKPEVPAVAPAPTEQAAS